MEANQTKIVTFQVSRGCSRNCESCSKYFDCSSKLKYDIYNSPALRKIEDQLAGVKYKIAVMSGKGGVGKSTSTGMLAYALANMGLKVGVLDSDFYGPSMPTIMGTFGKTMGVGAKGMLPVVNDQGILVASSASTMGEDDCVTWMGDQIRWALYSFLGNTNWGELDYLLIDLPPGTGEETTNMMKAIRGLSGGVIVTIPSEVSQIVVGRGITLCKKADTKLVGLIENMGALKCPNCETDINVFMAGGGKRVADKAGINFLGTVPLDRRVSEACDEGVPFIVKFPDSDITKKYMEIAAMVRKEIEVGA